MSENYTQQLERIVAQMLTPIRNIPFQLVIKSLSGHDVYKVDLNDPMDNELVNALDEAVKICAVNVQKAPILRPRPNEVGNDIEPFVMNALIEVGFKSVRPASKSGGHKATGYPDILITDEYGRAIYIEVKTYSANTVDTSMRSFYLSPSESFKVSKDARHLVVSFEMVRTDILGNRNSEYVPVGYKIVDVHGLLCDVKFEFNSDNARMYDKAQVLRSGSC